MNENDSLPWNCRFCSVSVSTLFCRWVDLSVKVGRSSPNWPFRRSISSAKCTDLSYVIRYHLKLTSQIIISLIDHCAIVNVILNVAN
jgi:hypothetical protein